MSTPNYNQGLRSLKETLLEYVLVNDDTIVDYIHMVLTGMKVTFPRLPLNLFEKILATGDKIGWETTASHMDFFFRYRNIINWRDIDSHLSGKGDLCGRKFNKILSLEPKVKRLKVHIFTIFENDPDVMQGFSRVSGTLEHLDLLYEKKVARLRRRARPPLATQDPSVGFVWQWIRKLINVIGGEQDAVVLRLKSLKFHNSIQDFPIKLDVKSLQILDIEYTIVSKESLDFIKRFRNLRHLSLQSTKLKECDGSDVLNTVTTLSELRTLNLQDIAISKLERLDVSDEDMKNILSRLCHLEELNLIKAKLVLTESFKPQRRIRVLRTDDAAFLKRDDLSDFALTILGSESMETVDDFINHLKLYKFNRTSPMGLVLSLMTQAEAWDVDSHDKFEELLSLCMTGRDKREQFLMLLLLIEDTPWYQPSDRILRKLASLTCSCLVRLCSEDGSHFELEDEFDNLPEATRKEMGLDKQELWPRWLFKKESGREIYNRYPPLIEYITKLIERSESSHLAKKCLRIIKEYSDLDKLINMEKLLVSR